MHFKDMPYKRITYEENEKRYQELLIQLQEISSEEECLALMKKRYLLEDDMTAMELCYVRHDMDLNDPFYAAEQDYYDEIGPKISDLSSRLDRAVAESPFQECFEKLIASLNPRMTVRDIIAEGLIIQGIKDKEYINNKVYEILERVGLVKEHAGRYPHEFSGGQRQRIGIARAIIMKPELIIADEPVSALDVSITCSLLSAIPLPDPNYEKKRKRKIYEYEKEHDYSEEQPVLQEITPGHFVSCNAAELKKYRKILEST